MIPLALIGALEAVVHLLRIRSASRASAWRSGFWAFAVCVLRAWFMAAGVGEILHGAGPWAVATVYAGSAGLATVWVHARMEAKDDRGPRP